MLTMNWRDSRRDVVFLEHLVRKEIAQKLGQPRVLYELSYLVEEEPYAGQKTCAWCRNEGTTPVRAH